MFHSKGIYPIALDMSGNDLYAAQLKGTRRGPVVGGLAYRKCSWDLEGDRSGADDLVSALRELRKDRRFSGKRVALQPPSRDISSFHIRVRAENPDILEEAILRESREYISFPFEEAIIDYPSWIPVSGDESGECKVTITAIHRKQIQQYLRVFKRVGMVVEVVDFDVCSLIRLHRALHQIPENPVILCNIDDTQSMISIITDNGILAERHISWGFGSLVEKVQSNLELSEDQSKTERLLQKYGLAYQEAEDRNGGEMIEDEIADSMRTAIYQITMPHIEDLVDEFHKMTAYLRSEETEAFLEKTFIEKIYMYGCANLIHGLDQYLEERLNIPTTLVDPLATLHLKDESLLPDPFRGNRFGPALGLALRRVKWL